jgi:hypothetical protein
MLCIQQYASQFFTGHHLDKPACFFFAFVVQNGMDVY